MTANSKSVLLKTLNQTEKQVQRVQGIIETKEEELRQIENKVKLGIDVQKLIKEAEEENKGFEDRLEQLNDVIPTIEARAADENSRQNSTPEVRAVNQQIEAISNIERAKDREVSQLQIDINYIKHEIDVMENEYQKAKEENAARLNLLNSTIQETRNEISQLRVDNLQKMLKEKYDHTIVHAELTRHNSLSMFYPQLQNGLTELVGLIPDKTKLKKKADEFIAQIETTLKSIPSFPPSNNEAIKKRFDKGKSDIVAFENKIMSSIKEMTITEQAQDDIHENIGNAQQEYQILQEKLIKSSEQLRDLAHLKQQMIDNDASKLTKANAEIKQLDIDIENLKNSNKAKQKKLADLTNFRNSKPDGQSLSKLEILTNQILHDVNTQLKPQLQQIRKLEVDKNETD